MKSSPTVEHPAGGMIGFKFKPIGSVRISRTLSEEDAMSTLTRRHAFRIGAALAIPPAMLTLGGGCQPPGNDPVQPPESKDAPKSGDSLNREPQASHPSEPADAMQIQYLEIVTPEVDALCRQYATIYDLPFSEPDANLGGARTAKLKGGGMIGIRGPLRDTETPVVRPYLLVADIQAAVKSAAEAGAEIAMPPTTIPEHGLFAIVIHGGIECGFWQN